MTDDCLKIKREMGDFDIVRFSFRYCDLDLIAKEVIENDLCSLKSNTNKLPDGKYVISIPLSKAVEPIHFIEINEKLQLKQSQYGIFVSFTSSYDMSGFRLPRWLSDFYRVVGGEFDCSIILI